MPKKTGQDATVKIDGTTGALTDVTCTLNSFDITSNGDTMEVSDLCDDEKEFLMGLVGATFTLNGFADTTAHTIFGPLVGNRTSKTKTVQWDDGTHFYSGELWVKNVQFGGAVNQPIVFSGGGDFTGSVTKSSKSL